MIVNGHIENGAVVLDDRIALPEGAVVRIEVLPPPTSPREPDGKEHSLGQRLMKHSGVIDDLPADFAHQHDHYLHGTAKR